MAQHGSGRGLPIAVAVAGGILLLLLGAVLVLGRAPGDAVLAGVRVEGRDVGGVDRTRLEEVVAELATERTGRRVVVRGSRETVETTREGAGERVDVAATVEDAWSRGRAGFLADLRDRLRARMGADIDVPLQVGIDEDAVRSFAADTASTLTVTPREGAVAFVGGEPPSLEVVDAQDGLAVDGEALAEALREQLDGPGDVAVQAPESERLPTIRQADVDAVVPAAERAISGPVILTHPAGGQDLGLSPAALAEVLRIAEDPEAPSGQRLRVEAVTELVVGIFGDRISEIDIDPVDATVSLQGGQVAIGEGRTGFRLDQETAAQTVATLATGAGERTAELPGEVVEPDLTTEEARDLGVAEPVATFTTSYPCCPGRVTNIKRFAELVNGALIRPGERFSLNDHVGPRTEANGFVLGGVIQDGRFEEAVGGGVSQFATTFFNTAFFAGIEIVRFQPHSFYISRYPVGRESTINYPSIDVVVENDSPYGILVESAAGDTSVTVTFWSTPWAEVEEFTGEPYDRVAGEVRDGFTVDFGRVITYPDGRTRRNEWTHTYRPENNEE